MVAENMPRERRGNEYGLDVFYADPACFKEGVQVCDLFTHKEDPDRLLKVVFVIPGRKSVMAVSVGEFGKATKYRLSDLRWKGHVLNDGRVYICKPVCIGGAT